MKTKSIPFASVREGKLYLSYDAKMYLTVFFAAISPVFIVFLIPAVHFYLSAKKGGKNG
ncbi:hypothetical protein [Massilibacteroides vaginae]|uniref:hypothetical protein n=1 Tax=Massilibacteroides vaginae TaxID=1673718 RepID=UPI001593D72E|nr:hypothetical protein [Massilibacteroides vaginae]